MRGIAAGLTGAALALGFGQQVSAAELPVHAAPVAAAPAALAPAVAATWTGFYIGVNAGGAWQSCPDWSFKSDVTPKTTVNTGCPGFGAVGGLQTGYIWQFASAWVAGVEGDISWASLQDHRSLQPAAVLPNAVATQSLQMSASTQWLSSARARLGVVAWNTLWYATGGAAWTSVEYNATSVFTLLGTPLQNSFSATRTKTGWVAGAGAEWMATTNILLRAEYLYYRFDGGTSGEISLLPVQASGQPRVTWSGDSVQVGRVAVSYLF